MTIHRLASRGGRAAARPTMRTSRLGIVSALLIGVALAAPRAATADEAKAPISAAILLNVLNAPVESRDAAFEKSLREAGPAPRPSVAGEVLDDGSVRYGRAVVTVRTPCLPGALPYEPPPLPGRRARN